MKERKILSTWFLREEYINVGWFKRLRLRIEFVFHCLLPDIIAYYESEQGQKEFAEWKAQQEAAKKEKSEVA